MTKSRNNQTKEWRVRREAGEWVRMGLRTRAISVGATLSFFLGALVTVYLGTVFGAGVLFWPIVAITGVAVTAALIFEKKNLRNWVKGSVAERHVGSVIEAALTAPGCAVAHSVTQIPNTVGDIDHLVATPGRLWCVETKYGRVPKKQFRNVLLRIKQNATALQAWAPQGVEVVGCLVIGHDATVRPRRSYEDGNVRVFSPVQIHREIESHRAGATPTDSCKEVRQRILKLSGMQLSDG